MAEPRLLQVGNEETTAKEKGESGLSSAQVGTEAKIVEKASEEPKGVYVANENVVSDNSKALRTSKEAPKGQYVAPTERLGGFERSAGEKGVVNTITVDEVKALIKQYGGSGDTYTKEEIDQIVETMRKGLYQEVDTTEYPTLEDFLDSDGEEGIIYLYPVGNEGNNYYQYIWETTKEWISLGTTVVDLSQYAKLTLLAPIYDSTSTYSVGNKVIYNGKLYTCSTAITTAEEWNSSHWTEISVSSGFVDLDSDQTGTGIKNFPSTFNVINASDIVNNTLTQAQYDLITNGKPTLIKGHIFNNKVNPILFTPAETNTTWNGLLYGVRDSYGNIYLNSYSINKTTKVISETERLAFLGASLYISTIGAINGKKPEYYLNNVYPYSTNSTTELKYEEINNISLSADTTYTLATAPSNTYPEYKGYITNSSGSAKVITLPTSVTKIKASSSLTVVQPTISGGSVTVAGTVAIPDGAYVEFNLQNGLIALYNWNEQ